MKFKTFVKVLTTGLIFGQLITGDSVPTAQVVAQNRSDEGRPPLAWANAFPTGYYCEYNNRIQAYFELKDGEHRFTVGRVSYIAIINMYIGVGDNLRDLADVTITASEYGSDEESYDTFSFEVGDPQYKNLSEGRGWISVNPDTRNVIIDIETGAECR